jgi:hypothetical protein
MTSVNVLPSLPSLQSLYSAIINDVSYSTCVTPFLNNPIADASNAAATQNYTSLVNFMTAKKVQGASNEDILVALDDGTVIYDSGKTNTFASYITKTINENHNTRPEILNATLSSSGTGYSRRYSSSAKAIRQYYAVRVGGSPQSNIGTIRIALQEYDTTLSNF